MYVSKPGKLLIVLQLLVSFTAVADTTSIAFGSCLRQWNPVPALQTVRSLSPDAFIFAGDNMYSDSGFYRLKAEPGRITTAYQELAERPEYKALKDAIPLYATWDDHDYGRNNAGAEYPWKTQAKSAFMKFFDVPDDAAMRERAGIYAVHYLGDGDQRIQIILLDTRTFRDPLQYAEPNAQCPHSRLVGTPDTSTTLLGEDQWNWLAQQLGQPAALRLLVSSIQVIPDAHCFEKWGNFPHERQRLISLLRDTGAKRTVLISGDRHHGDISALPAPDEGFSLYEITASGLNSARAGNSEHNPYRVIGDNVRVDHFGMVRLRRDQTPHVELTLHAADGAVLQQYLIDYASWQPGVPAGRQ